MKKLITSIIVLFSTLPFVLFAQNSYNNTYPQHYFEWPVKTTVGIVANFGELRPNHYHMGLDCRTDGRVNVPIVAAADGYIAKIHVDPTGFGSALYINHPNGLTTLYAHLNSLNLVLEKYLIEQQYLQKKWKVDIIVPAGLLVVKQGDFIAYSGNTGGSQGPHLHFEIRDTKSDNVLNPLLFGLPIEDNVAPELYRIAVYDSRMSVYEQSPKIYILKKTNGIYSLIGGSIKVTTDKVIFAISAVDKYTGSSNPNGIFSANLFDNEQFVSGFEMNNINYDETRFLNAHIDYKTKSKGGPYLQFLSPLPGYTNGIYKTNDNNKGVINLKDFQSHAIKIIVGDANQNVSTIAFDLIRENTETKISTKSNAKRFLANHLNIYESENLSFFLPENAIYDDFDIEVNESAAPLNNKIYKIQNDNIPVQCNFPIKIKADFSKEDTGKIVMKQIAGPKTRYKKAIFEKGWYKASFRDFGTYQLLLDKEPPIITPLYGFRDGVNTSRMNSISFKVTDDTKPVDSFDGYIDGNWILFSNDKEISFNYVFDKYCPPGEHNLKLIVKDISGNTTEKNYHFTR